MRFQKIRPTSRAAGDLEGDHFKQTMTAQVVPTRTEQGSASEERDTDIRARGWLNSPELKPPS